MPLMLFVFASLLTILFLGFGYLWNVGIWQPVVLPATHLNDLKDVMFFAKPQTMT